MQRVRRRGFSLKHLADKHELSAFVSKANAVADHTLPEHRRELGCEIAHLVGVREKDQVWLGRFHHLLQCNAKTVRRIGFEQIMLDQKDLGDVF